MVPLPALSGAQPQLIAALSNAPVVEKCVRKAVQWKRTWRCWSTASRKWASMCPGGQRPMASRPVSEIVWTATPRKWLSPCRGHLVRLQLKSWLLLGSSQQEGHCPCKDCAVSVYHLLVPLNPCCGHSFQLQLNTQGKPTCILSFLLSTKLLCPCTREQLLEDMLSFLHRSDLELRKEQDPSLPGTFCICPYLIMVPWLGKFESIETLPSNRVPSRWSHKL